MWTEDLERIKMSKLTFMFKNQDDDDRRWSRHIKMDPLEHEEERLPAMMGQKERKKGRREGGHG